MFDRKKYKRFALMQIKGRWTPAILATLLSLIILQPLTYIIVFGIQNEKSVFLPVITYIFSKWVLDIGFAHFFITMSRSPSPIKVNDFVEGLSEWKKGCTVGFWKDLWITLWSMLFIIPGLVKHYAYSQSIFLAAEFPNLTAKKAVHISKIITNNHKADLFVMDISFLGWQILSALVSNIGDLWLLPYIRIARINAFHDMLQQAIDENLIKLEDLTPNQ